MTLPIRTALPAALLALALAAQPALAQTETDDGAEAAGGADAAAADGDAGGDADPLAGLSAETVIAEVGGRAITLGELIAVRRALPEQYQSLPGEVLLEGLTDQLVTQATLADRARASGLDERTDVRLTLRNLEMSALADAYMRAEINARVDDAAVEEAYRARYAEAEPEQEIRASHILVETEERAAELRTEIEEGAEFAALAREHGTDGTAEQGGDLGWFAEGDMVPEFSDAAFALEEEGAVSQPVESPFGWHLIKLTGRRDKPVPELAEVEQELRRSLVEEAQEAIVEEARGAVEAERLEGDIPPEAVFADELILPEGD